MALNIGSAVAYLELDTSKFQKGLSSALSDLKVFTDKSATADQKLSGLQSSFKTVGSTLTKNVTVPLLGVGAAAVKTATDFEKQMSNVKAISGATGDEFQALQNTAIELGAATSFSASEVAGAMTEMAKAGWDSQQIIEGMKGVLDATAASGEDLASVSTIIADAITTFGLEASESTRVADLLTQAANAGTISVSDLGESFKYIGPVAKTMGFSIEDVTTAITALSQSGIKGSQAGTTLRSMFTRMVKPTDAVADAMKELNIVLTDGEGNFKSMDTILGELRKTFRNLTPEQQTYYAAVLAGQEGMSGLTALLGMTQEEYNAVAESMDNASGVAEDTADVMKDNLAGALEQLGGALESAGIILGQKLIPYIRRFAEWITELIQKFNDLDPETQDFIVKAGLIVAAIGPSLLILSKIAGVLGAVAKAVQFVSGVLVPAVKVVYSLKTGFTLAELTMMGFSKKALSLGGAIAGISAPAVILVGVLATLAGAFVTLWNNSREFRENITETFNKIKDRVKEFADDFIEKINELGFEFENITDLLQTLWENFCEFLAPVFEGAFEEVYVIVDTVLDLILDVVSLFVDLFNQDWEGVKEDLINIFWDILEGASEFVSNLLETIGDLGAKILETLGFEEASQKFQEFFDNLSEWVEKIPEYVQQIPDKLVEVKDRIVTFFTVDIQEAFNTFVNETIPNFINSVVQWFQQLPYRIGYAIGQIIGQLYLWAQNMIVWVQENVPLIIDNIVQWFQQLPGRIWTWLTNVVSDIVAWGSEMVASGKQAASDFVNSAVTTIQNLPGKIWGIIQKIPGKVRQVGADLKQAGKDIFNSLWDGIKSIGESILGWVGDFASSIGDFVSGIVSGFRDIVSGANDAKAASASVDGSHANGLAYVPFDGYIAELHKGERVLTAKENQEYNKGRSGSGTGDTFVFYNTKPDPYEYSRQFKKAKQELLQGI